ncbi:MAG: NUDIX hydrolase [Desulfobacterales bacterium]|nr:NUDIX hydrolase [Desulfobacterales bacterium]
MARKARVNSSAIIHRGRVFTLSRENVTLMNGVTMDVDVIRHPGAAAIVPRISEKNILLIRQYRHAIGDYIWEIPAGTLDPNETIETCAKRELTEETGHAAGEMQKIGEIVPVPGYSDERIHIFLADNLTPSHQNLDADEVLDVHEIPFSDAISMIQAGEIMDSKTISGLYMALPRFEKRRSLG